jgi:class 3 adenylate cyclase
LTLSTFPKGFFSAIDSIHVHVDGGVAAELVESMVKWLDHEGYPSKVTSIQDAIAGPQRKDLAPTYKSHTPGADDQEKLEYFSTTRFNSIGEAKQPLRRLLGELVGQNGIVIEVEQIIGKIGQDICWSKTPLREIPIIHSVDVGFERANTLPIEIHYGCDIPKKLDRNETAPLALETLLDVCAELEIRVGGWFLFEESDTWCYRSNMFEGNVRLERVKKQRDDLAEHLTRIIDELGFKCEVTALVERSLGVWKTPLTPWTAPRTEEFKEPEELAKWEEDYPNLKSFWVVAGNFLGDLRPDVRRAMVQNLRKRVEYIYFLRSHADLQRLRQFAKTLSNQVPRVEDYLRAILLSANGPQSETANFQGEYFIANPHLTSAQAYELVRAEDKRIKVGRLIKSTETGRLTKKLRTLLRSTSEIQGWSVPIQEEPQRPVHRAVVYTDLKGSTTFQEQVGDANWECVLLEYDLIVAEQVSILQGEVVKNLGDGYLLVFEQAADALLCAEGLQKAILKKTAEMAADSEQPGIPPHRIALDFGPVTKVMRAHGPDYTGKTLSRCSRLIHEAVEYDILMFKTFREDVAAAFGLPWITNKTKSKGKINIKGLEGAHEIWEFLWKE